MPQDLVDRIIKAKRGGALGDVEGTLQDAMVTIANLLQSSVTFGVMSPARKRWKDASKRIIQYRKEQTSSPSLGEVFDTEAETLKQPEAPVPGVGSVLASRGSGLRSRVSGSGNLRSRYGEVQPPEEGA